MALNYTSLAKRSGSYGSSQDELFNLMGEQQRPKVGALSRLLALPSALGSVPDAIYGAKYENKNPLTEYFKNIGSGVATTLTGKKYGEDLKTTSDILKKGNVLAGSDLGSRIGRGALGFIGDVALDPTTYLTFGTAGLGKAGAKAALTGLSDDVLKQVAKKGLKSKLIGELAEGGTKNIMKKFGKELGETTAQRLGGQLSRKSLNLQKTIGANIPFTKIGKTITPTSRMGKIGAEVAKFGAEPFSVVGGGLWKGAKKFAPEATETISKEASRIFSPDKFADKVGLGGIFGRTKKFAKQQSEQGRRMESELGIVAKEIRKLTPEGTTQKQAAKLADLFEYSKGGEFNKTVEKGRTFAEDTTNKLMDAGILSNPERFTKNQIADRINKISELEGLLKNAPKEGQAPTELINAAKGLTNLDLDNLPTTQSKEILDNMMTEVGDSLSKTKQEFGKQLIGDVGGYSDDIQTINVGKKFPDWIPEEHRQEKLVKGLYDSYINNTIPEKGKIKKLYDLAVDNVNDDLTRQGINLTPGLEEINKNLTLIGGEPDPTNIKSLQNLLSDTKGKLTKSESTLSTLMEGQRKSYLGRNVEGFTEDFIKKKFPELQADILSDPVVSREVDKLDGVVSKDTLNKVLDKRPELAAKVNQINAEKILGGSLKQRAFKTRAEGLQEGVVYSTDLAKDFLDGQINNSKALRAHEYVRGLEQEVDDFGNKILHKADTSDAKALMNKPGWIKKNIPDFGDVVMRKDAAEMITGYTKDFFGDEGMKGLMSIYDKGLTAWKASVTGLGPGFIGYNVRNAIGDMTNMILDGFRNPKYIKTGVNVLQFESLAQKEGLGSATGEFGKNISDLYHKALDEGLLTHEAGLLAEQTGGLSERMAGKGISQKTKSLGSKVMDRWKQVATVGGLAPKREEAFRLAHFASTLDKTGSIEEAGKAVRRTLFDYNDLSPTEKNVFKRIIPFYSFTRKNLEFHAKNYAKRPGKYTAFNKLLNTVREIGGGDMSDEDWEAMPDWMKEGAMVGLGSKDGMAKVITGFGLPTENIEQTLGGNEGIIKGGAKNLASMMAPMLKVPMEAVTGKSLFTGRDIDQETYGGRYAQYPELIKKILGYNKRERTSKEGKKYSKETVDPIRSYILANTPVLSGLSTQYKRGVEASGGDSANILNLLSGLRVYERNIDSEKEARKREQQDVLARLLARQGLATQYSNTYIPQEYRQELLQKYQ